MGKSTAEENHFDITAEDLQATEGVMRHACAQAVAVTERDGYEAEKVIIVTIDKEGNVGVLPTGFDDVLSILGMLHLAVHSFIANHTTA